MGVCDESRQHCEESEQDAEVRNGSKESSSKK